MQPVIEVQCPFCKARGQIVTPPLGAIIVGPCPRCQELVLLFGGAVLPLDKETILQGTATEKKTHLTETIMEMVVNRIDELVDSAEDQPAAADGDIEAVDEDEPVLSTAAEEPPVPVHQPSYAVEQPSSAITEQEVRDFLAIDLHLIDDKKHFDRIFGPH